MGFNLLGLLKGVENAIGTAADAVIPGDQSSWHQQSAPPPPATTRPQPAQQVGRAASTIAHNAVGGLWRGATGLSHLANNTANFSNQHIFDPFIRDGIITPAINTGENIGNLAVGSGVLGKDLQPYAQKVNPVSATGDAAITALNAFTGGGAGAVANKLAAPVAEKIGATAAGRIGNNMLGKAAQNVIKTTIQTAPISTAQGAAGVLSKGDTNPLDIAKGAAGGLAAAPAFGLVHGAAPIAGEGARATSKLARDFNTHLNESIKNPDVAQALTAKGLSPADAQAANGYFATPSAANFDKHVASGKPVTTFSDGLTGVEVSDKGAKLKDQGVQQMLQGQSPSLGNVLDHPKLQSDYPTLFGGGTGGVKVKLDAGDNTARGFYNNSTNTIHINPNVLGNTPERVANTLKTDQGKKIMVHEISHAIDSYSGVTGQTPWEVENALRAHQGMQPSEMDTYRAYNATPSEQRALMQENRMNMSQGQIDNNPIGVQPTPFRLPGAGAGTGDPIAALREPGVVQNSLTAKGKAGRQNISPELQGAISGEHVVRNTKNLGDSAAATADTAGLDKTIQAAHDALNVPDGHIDDKTVALAHQAIERADSAGRLEDANALHDALSNHLLKSGQTSQAASLLYQRSPQGMLYRALKDIKKAGVEVTPAIKKELQGHVDAIKGMQPGPMRDFAKAAFGKAITKHLPQGKLNNAVSLWKAGLLSGVKTQGGNFLSNATFAGMKKLADVPATLVDKGISLKTGERTKTLSAKGAASGTSEGLKTAKTTLKTGIDVRNVGDKYEQHAEINFKNPIVQKVLGNPANLIFRGMQAADQPFYYAALKNSLYDQAKADGINKGLSGKALTSHMGQLVQSPTSKLMETAAKEANKSVLNYDTFASKAISGLKQGIDKSGFSESGKQIAHGVVDFLVPFSRVPSAFLSRTVDFTPLGVGKEVFTQISHKQFDQRSLSQAIGEGLTGTGAIALGISLTHNNMLSGDYPKNDAKEAARWKAEGITPNSVKLGGKWVSLNYMGPLGLLFSAGQHMVAAEQTGTKIPGQIAQGLAGMGQGLMGQSFLQGMSNFTDAIKDPTRFGQNFIHQSAGSIVPSLVNDVGNATDNFQRQANNVSESIQARIPGLREGLHPKQDAFGNDLKQAAGGLNTAINPLKPSDSLSTDVTNEIDRLKATGKNNFVMPTTDKTLQVGSQTVKLTTDQQYQWNQYTGQATEKAWAQLIQDPGYQKLSDDQKANALQAVMKDINAVSKAQFLSSMGQNDLAKQVTDKLTTSQYKLLTGGNPVVSDYTAAQTPKPPKAPKAPRTAKAPKAPKAPRSTAKKASGTPVARAARKTTRSTGVAKAKKSQFNYAKLLAATPGSTAKNFSAIRNLVKAPKFTRSSARIKTKRISIKK